jgi:hypothetical protein
MITKFSSLLTLFVLALPALASVTAPYFRLLVAYDYDYNCNSPKHVEKRESWLKPSAILQSSLPSFEVFLASHVHRSSSTIDKYVFSGFLRFCGEPMNSARDSIVRALFESSEKPSDALIKELTRRIEYEMSMVEEVRTYGKTGNEVVDVVLPFIKKFFTLSIHVFHPFDDMCKNAPFKVITLDFSDLARCLETIESELLPSKLPLVHSFGHVTNPFLLDANWKAEIACLEMNGVVSDDQVEFAQLLISAMRNGVDDDIVSVNIIEVCASTFSTASLGYFGIILSRLACGEDTPVLKLILPKQRSSTDLLLYCSIAKLKAKMKRLITKRVPFYFTPFLPKLELAQVQNDIGPDSPFGVLPTDILYLISVYYLQDSTMSCAPLVCRTFYKYFHHRDHSYNYVPSKKAEEFFVCALRTQCTTGMSLRSESQSIFDFGNFMYRSFPNLEFGSLRAASCDWKLKRKIEDQITMLIKSSSDTEDENKKKSGASQ